MIILSQKIVIIKIFMANCWGKGELRKIYLHFSKSVVYYLTLEVE